MPAKVKSMWRVNLVSISVFMLAGVVAGLLLLRSFAAGSAALYVSPSSATVDVNSNFTVNVMVNTNGSSVSAVDVKVTYDTAKLQLVSKDYSSSAFTDYVSSPSTSAGTVQFLHAQFSPLNGDLLIGRITFKAIAGSGSTSLSFTGDSEAAFEGSSIVGSRTGATINLNTPASTPPPSSGGGSTQQTNNTGSSSGSNSSNSSGSSTTTNSGSSNTTTGSEPTTSASPENPEGPSITNLETIEVGFKKAIIKFNTSKPATATVEYGESQDLGSVAESKEAKQEHSVSLTNSLLKPGTTHYYKVTVSDADGNKATSDVLKFTTRGYYLIIKLSQPDGKPLAKVPVQLFSEPREGTTDDIGQVEFDNVAFGEHTIKYNHNGKDYEQKLEVSDVLSLANVDVADDTEVNPQVYQVFAVKSTSFSSKTGYLTTIAIVLIIGMIGFGVTLFIKNRKLSLNTISSGVGEVSVGGVGIKPKINAQKDSGQKQEDDPIKRLLESEDDKPNKSL